MALRRLKWQVWLVVVLFLNSSARKPVFKSPLDIFKKTIAFQKYRFEAVTSATGAVRELVLKVFDNEQLLITIRQKIDGTILNAEVADLDRNGSPEVYLYSCTYGSGSFGRVYAFQFFPDSFGAISTETLTATQAEGYMGHDAFRIENGFLARKFPVYRPGDANAQPTGGTRSIGYELKEMQGKLVLLSKL